MVSDQEKAFIQELVELGATRIKIGEFEVEFPPKFMQAPDPKEAHPEQPSYPAPQIKWRLDAEGNKTEFHAPDCLCQGCVDTLGV